MLILKMHTNSRLTHQPAFIIRKSTPQGASHLTGNALSSQSVSRQVLSAYECLTTVFGMGTGGTTQLSSPDIYLVFYEHSKLYRRNFVLNILALKDKPSIY